MSDLDRLLSEYLAAHEAGGGPPDPRPFLDRASPDERSALARRIDEHLAAAPRRAWDPAAFEATLQTPLMREIATSARGASGLWPALLPRLRNAAQLRRQEVVARLAGELGVADREAKVHDYYHRMEQGLLDQDGVSDTVLEKLAAIVGSSREALREAGRALGEAASPDAPASGPVFARRALADEAYAAASPDAAELAREPGEEVARDEVDELFTGRQP